MVFEVFEGKYLNMSYASSSMSSCLTVLVPHKGQIVQPVVICSVETFSHYTRCDLFGYDVCWDDGKVVWSKRLGESHTTDSLPRAVLW